MKKENHFQNTKKIQISRSEEGESYAGKQAHGEKYLKI